MSASPLSLIRGHKGSRLCKATIIQQQQWEHRVAAAQAQLQVFTINGVDLKKVENFKYLGRQICHTDSDAPALFMNLNKARKRLHQLFCLIAREGADPVVGRRIYVGQSQPCCCTVQRPGFGT